MLEPHDKRVVAACFYAEQWRTENPMERCPCVLHALERLTCFGWKHDPGTPGRVVKWKRACTAGPLDVSLADTYDQIDRFAPSINTGIFCGDEKRWIDGRIELRARFRHVCQVHDVRS